MNAQSNQARVSTLHSITKLTPAHAGQVVIAASHGGVYAGYCAALEPASDRSTT